MEEKPPHWQNKETTINFNEDLRMLMEFTHLDKDDIYVILKQNKNGNYLIKSNSTDIEYSLPKKRINYFEIERKRW